MNEENQTAPKTKKGGSAKKVVLIFALVILVAAIVVGVLFATGVLDVNLSKPSKMVAGVEKIGETVTEAMDNLNPEGEANSIKILENINTDSALEVSGEISAKIDDFDVEGVSSSDAEAINKAIDLINVSKLGMNIKFDENKKIYASVDGKLDDVNLSGEVVYDGDKAAARSKEINEKWLAIDKKTIEDAMKSENIDAEAIAEASKKVTDKLLETAKSMEVDEKTQKEIEERYSDVLQDYIKEKSKDIKSEKAKIKVDGKEKSCDKLTLKLNDEDAKKLLISYIDTFKNDKQLQDLVKKMLNAYADMYSEMEDITGEEIDGLDEIEGALDQILDNIDELKDEINEIEFDGDVTLTVYGTNTKTYRTDISIDVDGTEVTLQTTFNEKTTEIDVKMKSSGMSVDVAKITIESDKNMANIKVETSDALEDVIGTKMFAEMKIKTEGNKSELTLSADLGEYGKGTITLNENVIKNEANEYTSETTISADLDITDVATVKGSVTLKTTIKTSNVSIPSVNDDETVDAMNQTEVQTYLTESQSNITKLIDDISKIEALEGLITEDMINQLQNTIPEITTPDTDGDTTPNDVDVTPEE